MSYVMTLMTLEGYITMCQLPHYTAEGSHIGLLYLLFNLQ